MWSDLLLALVRPAVSNRRYDYCAMGASVYRNAAGAMKDVNEAATSLLDHMRVGRSRTFVYKTLIEARTGKGTDTAADMSRSPVNGKAHHDKVAFLSIPKRVSEAAYAEYRRNLCDRDGTGYELVSEVSRKKREHVTDSFRLGLKSQACGLTAKQVKACGAPRAAWC